MVENFGIPGSDIEDTSRPLLALLPELDVEKRSDEEEIRLGGSILSEIREAIRKRVSSREGHPVYGRLVVEDALVRYFSLLERGRQSLQERFTLKELVSVANVEPSAVWEYSHIDSLASKYADDQGIESLEDLPPGSSGDTLMRKLLALTPLENAALVDIMERIWRSQLRSFPEELEHMGIRPADELRDDPSPP